MITAISLSYRPYVILTWTISQVFPFRATEQSYQDLLLTDEIDCRVPPSSSQKTSHHAQPVKSGEGTEFWHTNTRGVIVVFAIQLPAVTAS